jgi:hypothetical protein
MAHQLVIGRKRKTVMGRVGDSLDARGDVLEQRRRFLRLLLM